MVVNAVPWLTWFLWKNRNKLLFEGKQEMLMDLVEKTFSEAEMWNLAQANEQQAEAVERGEVALQHKSWSPPPRGWVKCNIGVDWMKSTCVGGGSWVLRNEKGKVVLHGRRAFTEIKSLHDAKLEVLVWSVESIVSHHFDRVIFAIDDEDLTQMILRPKAWPNFKVQVKPIKSPPKWSYHGFNNIPNRFCRQQRTIRTANRNKLLFEGKQEFLMDLVDKTFAEAEMVIFAIDDEDLTQMILRPKAWPNFKGETRLIISRLTGIEWWRLVKEARANNIGALLIAKGVTKGGQKQSYVASGPPMWFLSYFENEEVPSSV
ncbi:hypothetical protein F2Q68_00020525 [Brassica cretica]|uniref:RNase H type-1 domain-containing protein n=1 Tax=Brassica cretica TaxID=69181 RepID=A0A8S9G4G7_BRACR|nr:hypothetical protein F2Q68_00020525 [Brassica cretica]